MTPDLSAYQKVFEFLKIDLETTLLFSGFILFIVEAVKRIFPVIKGKWTTIFAVILSAILSIQAYSLSNIVGVLFSTLLVWLIALGTHEWIGSQLSKASTVMTQSDTIKKP